MIINCNNCNKRFNIDSSLIPEKGRLLQCSSCNYKWFFKNEIINKPDLLIKDKKTQAKISPENTKFSDIEPVNNEISNLEPVIFESPEDSDFLEKKDKHDLIIDKNLESPQIKKKNYNILNITLVFIISFIAIVIIIDTFKSPIGSIVPNIEFLLYNLYESIKDIILFIKDLI